MTTSERPRATAPGLPIFTAEVRGAIRDNLVLALDALDAGPCDAMGLRYLMACQWAAITLTHVHGGVAP